MGSFKTIVIGFGKIGYGFSHDPVMAKYFRYASHAQVLRDHPDFSWEAVVDPSPAAQNAAREEWGVPFAVGSVEELPGDFNADVAVIATPPQTRSGLLERLAGLKGVLVEKPMGVSLEQSENFVRTCQRKSIAVQVNFWRRGDKLFRDLAQGKLVERIGRPYAVHGVYGNGLMNNGSHMIDFSQMLFGDAIGASVVSPESSFVEGPVPGDCNLDFLLRFQGNLVAVFQAISFRSYREVGMDIWGERGRLSILQEGLGVTFYPRRPNRAIQNEWEVASDQAEVLETTCGDALYHMYDNLARRLKGAGSLWISGESALRTESIVHDLLNQYHKARTEGRCK